MEKGSWLALSQYAFVLVVSAISTLVALFALRLLRTLKRQRNFDSSPSLLGRLAGG